MAGSAIEGQVATILKVLHLQHKVIIASSSRRMEVQWIAQSSVGASGNALNVCWDWTAKQHSRASRWTRTVMATSQLRRHGASLRAAVS
eukprot:6423435-Amphidinium_carterae.1